MRLTTPTRPERRRRARSFVRPVGIVGVLQVPERAAARRHRDDLEVVGRGRRGRGPLERPGVPRVVAGRSRRARSDRRCWQRRSAIADDLEWHAERGRRGSRSPSRGPARRCRCAAASRACPERACVPKVRLKPITKQPEVPAAEALGEHPAGHLGEPVVDRRRRCVKSRLAHQHEVEVRHHEVGVGQLPVERAPPRA